MTKIDDIRLNFSVFYYGLINGRTALRQYDIVNILLLGDYSDNCLETQISQSTASNYVYGRKAISKEILSAIFKLPFEDIKARTKKLQLQNIRECVEQFATYMLDSNIIENDECERIFALKQADDPYDFVTEVFLSALRCPDSCKMPITPELKNLLNSFGTSSNHSNTTKTISEPKLQSNIVPQPKTTGIKKDDITKCQTLLVNNATTKLPKELLELQSNTLNVQVNRYNLKFPTDYKTLNSYLQYYGTQIIRSLNEDEISRCMDFCENVRNSYITEIQGDTWSVVTAAIHYLSYKSCIHLVCIAEVPKHCELRTLRDMLLDIYDYACEDVPFSFALNYNDKIPRNEYLLRFIHSENICDENRHRNNCLTAKYAIRIEPDSNRTKLLPQFFTDYPEKIYYIMPLGPEYDPEMDDSEKVYEYMRNLLTIDRISTDNP